MEKGMMEWEWVDKLSPTTWAYVGDAVYELYMRLFTAQDGPRRSRDMHLATAYYANAVFQARAAKEIEPLLSVAEQDVLRRGRNVKTGHIPKTASPGEYRLSTGLEALIGYLYLSGQEERVRELMLKIRQMKESDII
ncbi:MAG: ribonuclease III domain-containing protein [bacterium]|nr:ribonuclease III domain-containing protein [bacterium]